MFMSCNHKHHGCTKRMQRYLARENVQKTEWTPEEKDLLTKIKEKNSDIDKITFFFPGRTPNDIKNEIKKIDKTGLAFIDDDDDEAEPLPLDNIILDLSLNSFPQMRNDTKIDAQPLDLNKFSVLKLSPETQYRLFVTLSNTEILVPIKLNGCTLDGFLNHGSFAVVVKYMDDATGKFYAAKFILKEFLDKTNPNFIQGETIIRYLDHPNIIQFHSFVILEDCYALFTKFYPNGDFLDFINANINLITPKMLMHFIYQMVEAVKYLHENGITHGDIKLENFLLDDSYNLILADFTHAQSPYHMINSIYGSEDHIPPELRAGLPSNPSKVDIYQLGITIKKIVRQSPLLYDKNLDSLLNFATQPDPEIRATLIDIIESPYYQNCIKNENQ